MRSHVNSKGSGVNLGIGRFDMGTPYEASPILTDHVIPTIRRGPARTLPGKDDTTPSKSRDVARPKTRGSPLTAASSTASPSGTVNMESGNAAQIEMAFGSTRHRRGEDYNGSYRDSKGIESEEEHVEVSHTSSPETRQGLPSRRQKTDPNGKQGAGQSPQASHTQVPRTPDLALAGVSIYTPSPQSLQSRKESPVLSRVGSKPSPRAEREQPSGLLTLSPETPQSRGRALDTGKGVSPYSLHATSIRNAMQESMNSDNVFSPSRPRGLVRSPQPQERPSTSIFMSPDTVPSPTQHNQSLLSLSPSTPNFGSPFPNLRGFDITYSVNGTAFADMHSSTMSESFRSLVRSPDSDTKETLSKSPATDSASLLPSGTSDVLSPHTPFRRRLFHHDTSLSPLPEQKGGKEAEYVDELSDSMLYARRLGQMQIGSDDLYDDDNEEDLYGPPPTTVSVASAAGRENAPMHTGNRSSSNKSSWQPSHNLDIYGAPPSEAKERGTNQDAKRFAPPLTGSEPVYDESVQAIDVSSDGAHFADDDIYGVPSNKQDRADKVRSSPNADLVAASRSRRDLSSQAHSPLREIISPSKVPGERSPYSLQQNSYPGDEEDLYGVSRSPLGQQRSPQTRRTPVQSGEVNNIWDEDAIFSFNGYQDSANTSNLSLSQSLRPHSSLSRSPQDSGANRSPLRPLESGDYGSEEDALYGPTRLGVDKEEGDMLQMTFRPRSYPEEIEESESDYDEDAYNAEMDAAFGTFRREEPMGEEEELDALYGAPVYANENHRRPDVNQSLRSILSKSEAVARHTPNKRHTRRVSYDLPYSPPSRTTPPSWKRMAPDSDATVPPYTTHPPPAQPDFQGNHHAGSDVDESPGYDIESYLEQEMLVEQQRGKGAFFDPSQLSRQWTTGEGVSREAATIGSASSTEVAAPSKGTQRAPTQPLDQSWGTSSIRMDTAALPQPDVRLPPQQSPQKNSPSAPNAVSTSSKTSRPSTEPQLPKQKMSNLLQQAKENLALGHVTVDEIATLTGKNIQPSEPEIRPTRTSMFPRARSAQKAEATTTASKTAQIEAIRVSTEQPKGPPAFGRSGRRSSLEPARSQRRDSSVEGSRDEDEKIAPQRDRNYIRSIFRGSSSTTNAPSKALQPPKECKGKKEIDIAKEFAFVQELQEHVESISKHVPVADISSPAVEASFHKDTNLSMERSTLSNASEVGKHEADRSRGSVSPQGKNRLRRRSLLETGARSRSLSLDNTLDSTQSLLSQTIGKSFTSTFSKKDLVQIPASSESPQMIQTSFSSFGSSRSGTLPPTIVDDIWSEDAKPEVSPPPVPSTKTVAMNAGSQFLRELDQWQVSSGDRLSEKDLSPNKNVRPLVIRAKKKATPTKSPVSESRDSNQYEANTDEAKHWDQTVLHTGLDATASDGEQLVDRTVLGLSELFPDPTVESTPSSLHIKPFSPIPVALQLSSGQTPTSPMTTRRSRVGATANPASAEKTKTSSSAALLLEIEDSKLVIRQLEGEVASLQTKLQQTNEEWKEKVQSMLESEKRSAEETLRRQLEFADQLIQDKKDLVRRIEVEVAKQDEIRAKMKSQFEEELKTSRHQITALEKKLEVEVAQARKVVETREKNAREKWEAEKMKEMREEAYRSLEPEINRLLQRHTTEIEVIQQAAAEQINIIAAEKEKEKEEALLALRAELSGSSDVIAKERLKWKQREQALIDEHEEQIRTMRLKFNTEIEAERKRTSELIRDESLKHVKELSELTSQWQKKVTDAVRDSNDDREAYRQKYETAIHQESNRLRYEFQEKERELREQLDKEIREREETLRKDFERYREETHSNLKRDMADRLRNEKARLEEEKEKGIVHETEKLREKVQMLESEKSELEDRITLIEEERNSVLASIRADLEEKKIDNTHLQSRLESQERENRSLKDKIQSLSDKIEVIKQAESHRFQNQREKLDAKIDILQKNLDSALSALEKEKATKERVATEFAERHKREIEAIRSRVSKLLQDRDAVIAELKEKVREEQEIAETAKRLLRESRERR